VVGLPDIAAFGLGDAGRRYGEERLAERRRQQARALLQAAGVEDGTTSYAPRHDGQPSANGSQQASGQHHPPPPRAELTSPLPGTRVHHGRRQYRPSTTSPWNCSSP
jgi:hypothetical protein